MSTSPQLCRCLPTHGSRQHSWWSEPSPPGGMARLATGTPRRRPPLSSGPTSVWRQASLSAALRGRQRADHVWTSTCLPNSSGRNCRKAKCTAHSSRQLMCQISRGPVQSPEAACPLHVTPQPVLEASVVTTVCRDTCYRGTSAHRKARSVQGLRERQHCWVIPTRSVPRRHAHLGTRECGHC